MVALVLRDAGFLVRTAVNGLEALMAAYEMQPAVIVMDMTMPCWMASKRPASSKPRKSLIARV
jgi:CheY-like chemotaxis protein